MSNLKYRCVFTTTLYSLTGEIIKRYIFLAFLLHSLSHSSEAQTINGVYFKYIPFSTKTVLPINEKIIQEMSVFKQGGMQEKYVFNRSDIINLSELIHKIINDNKPISIDYDLRLLIKISNDSNYINWDKKYLIYRKKIYSINNREFNKIINYIHCDCK